MSDDILKPMSDFNGDDLHQSILNKSSQDKFQIILDIPPILKPYNDRNKRKNDLINLNSWQFSPKSISLPAVQINAVEAPYKGQTMKVTSQTRTSFSPLKITFDIDNNFNNYHLLLMWLAVQNHPTQSGMDEYFAKAHQGPSVTEHLYEQDNSLRVKFDNPFFDYKTNITVFGLREYNEPIIKFTFYHAFITEIGGIEYDYSKPDIITSNATFAFDNFDTELLDYIPNEGKEKHKEGDKR